MKLDLGFVLPTDSEERKEIPIFSGVLNYFPLAIAAVARVSKRGNDKHNPGEPLHWARGKSMDHADCIARHLIDLETLGPTGEYEDAAALAWRALAKLQELEEARLGKPPSRGSSAKDPKDGTCQPVVHPAMVLAAEAIKKESQRWRKWGDRGWLISTVETFGCINDDVSREHDPLIKMGALAFFPGEAGVVYCAKCARQKGLK